MNTTDMMTDEEAMQSEPIREELLARSISTVPRRVGELNLRSMTSETFGYLWDARNYFLKGFIPDSDITRKNPVYAAAEFVYVHHADLNSIGQDMRDEARHYARVQEYLRGPLVGSQMLTAAVAVINEMVQEYFAVQNEGIANDKAPTTPTHYEGKEPARAGKPAT